MSSRNRPASINAGSAGSSIRRPPPALRGAPGSRGSGAKAHVSLSLVFAHGDAAPVPSSSASIRRVSRCISSPSEEALSRQLDRDTAGEHMSLRSRRSSAATLASRTDFSPHPLSPPLPEEHDEQPEAGPSSLDTLSTEQPFSATLPDTHSDDKRRSRTINPKSSAVWRRWNSPAPSFPKRDSRPPSMMSGRDDKSERGTEAREVGTDKRVDPIQQQSIPAPATTQSDNSSSLMQRPDSDSDSPTEEQNVPRTPDGARTPQDPTTPRLAPPKPDVVVQAPTPSKGWLATIWGSSRTTSPKPDKPPESHDKQSETPTQVKEATEASESAPSQINGVAGEPLSKVDSHTSGAMQQSSATNGAASKQRKVEMTSGPTWGPDSAPSASVEADTTPFQSAVQQMADVPAPETTVDESQPTQEDDPAVGPAEEAKPPQPGQPGWGPYLWSWVVPPPLPPLHPPPETSTAEAPSDTTTAPEAVGISPDSNAVHPDDIAADQKPVCEPTTCTEHTEEAQPEPRASSETVHDNNQSQVALGTSSSSTAGWLSYLAFRATQKRITGSTITPDDARRSGETHREEVMDLEGDPNFPGSEETPKAGKAKDNASHRVSVDSKASGTGTGTGTTTARAPHEKHLSRLSVDSKRPSSVTEGKPGKPSDKPASIAGSKPDTKSPADGKPPNGSLALSASNKRLTHKRSQNLAISSSRRLSESSSIHSSSSIPPSPRVAQGRQNNPASDLPPPPQTPARQPNFIIPTFETTFDRPPRSLLPRSTASGVGAATGLAVRALGALGSYVYGGHAESSEETRGKKEGRDIGADLPRKMSVVSSSPDDGWKYVRRVVVIGVHGWFPAKMLTSVIGEPTGTSTKFANMMGEAVRKFFRENNVDDEEIRLTLIPLEGEGTIESRVDKLYKQYLSNPAWINDLRRADAVLFAAHSQGCVVTTHLISRMIAQGHIRTPHNREAVARCEWAFGPIGIVPDENSKRGRRIAASLTGAEGGRQKVAMLAMCGVHLGPLYSISTSSVIGPYLQWFENAAARELFEFQDSDSPVSQAYQKALAMVLENEVKVLLLSSLNDQVVPIYGASFASATHPLLLRALYVDGASYSASDFMTNLLCFAFMLRNAGIDDQRLVEHLSEATAGSLTGVGHSTPYEELGCYSLAVQYLFLSGSAPTPLPPLRVEPFAARDGRNDFELPWIMRAIVDSPIVKDLFPDELQELKASIIAWRPQTKALKEIKKRLEPMAGRRHLSNLAMSTSTTDLKDKAKDKESKTEVRPALPGLVNHAPQDKKKPRVTPSRLLVA